MLATVTLAGAASQAVPSQARARAAVSIGKQCRRQPAASRRLRSCVAASARRSDDDGESAHGWGERFSKAAQRAVAAAAVTAVLSMGPMVVPQAAEAITDNQMLFLEAWRAVDRAYVDRSFNGQSWFRYRETSLKKETMPFLGDSSSRVFLNLQDTQSQTYTAIKKMLATLGDPFTRLLEPAQYSMLVGANRGDLSGVGLELTFGTPRTDGTSPLIVVSPTAGGPASGAGIRPLDEILSLDGQDIRGRSIFEAAELLQGPSGSEVTVEYLSKATDERTKVMLIRAPISVTPVTSAACKIGGRTSSRSVAADASVTYEDKLNDSGNDSLLVGIIRVSSFTEKTPAGVRDAIFGLKEAGTEAFVLDLRSNGGGSFPAGVEVARMLLNKGVVVYIADSAGVRDVVEAEGKALLPAGAPLTVLVNSGTASAAEVLAGALRDNNRALILGERTFGKGLIQTTVPLSDGSAVNVTVAKYQTPSGIDIHKVGIFPDGKLPVPDLPLSPAKACRKIAEAGLGSGVEVIMRGTKGGAAAAVEFVKS